MDDQRGVVVDVENTIGIDMLAIDVSIVEDVVDMAISAPSVALAIAIDIDVAIPLMSILMFLMWFAVLRHDATRRDETREAWLLARGAMIEAYGEADGMKKR